MGAPMRSRLPYMDRLVAVGPATLVAAALLVVGGSPSRADEGYHPYANKDRKVRTIDMSEAAIAARGAQSKRVVTPRDWSILDQVESSDSHLQLPSNPEVASDPSRTGSTPDGWVQRGNVVLPEPVANGDLQVDPSAIFQVENIPGNEYPRKHTLYLNFTGEDLLPGSDNSAESKSQLAKEGAYPAYQGGNQKAVAIAQAVADDVAPYGIRVLYLPEDRPSKTVPYTMEMMGGQWQDTNIDSPAGGVAPGADCGALGQRHVVYTFASGGLGTNTAANTASQEAGHGWGLDHTFNCGSVMSYCGVANGNFSETCDSLCEQQCQGPNSAGCRLTHEMFCGEGMDQQNEAAELTWIFGGNEPDVEPPFVNIVSPEDGAVLDSGANVDLRAEVGDNYGGYGWKFIIERDGEVLLDEVDYDREVDDQFRAALNLAALEDGNWTITVEVEDQFDHVTSQTVSFQVGDGTTVPADGTTGEDDDGTDDMSDESASDGIDGMSDSGNINTDPKGCSCRADRSGPVAAWAPLLLLFGAGAARRRR